MLREEIAQKTALGLSIAKTVAEGKFASDEMVCKLIENNLKDHKKIIFDGFPRTVNQAKKLDDLLESRGQKLNLVVELKVDPEAMVGRIAVRYLELQRPEDNPETFKLRLKDFYEKTIPVLEYYKEQGKVRTIDAMADVKTVNSAIKLHLAWN